MKHTAEDTAARFYKAVQPRLHLLGSVRTDDIWKLLREQFSYAAISQMFKVIMTGMVEQGKATIDTTTRMKGKYVIHRPPEKTVDCGYCFDKKADFIITHGDRYCRAACGEHLTKMTPNGGTIYTLKSNGVA